jgi:hypothetical protein
MAMESARESTELFTSRLAFAAKETAKTSIPNGDDEAERRLEKQEKQRSMIK